MVHAMEHKIWAVAAFTVYYVSSYILPDCLPASYAWLGSSLRFLQVGRMYFWPALFMVIVGAHFPDFDLDFGARFHRSPITHSFFIPLALFLFYLFQAPSPDILRLLAIFFLGYASHLLLDILPSGASLFGRFTSIFQSYTPGDVRGIPEGMEKGWLIGSGLLTLALAAVYLFLSVHPELLTLLPHL